MNLEQHMREAFDAGDVTRADLQAMVDKVTDVLKYRQRYALLKRDRLILQAAGWTIKESIPLLSAEYGFSEPTTRKIVEGSAGADVTAEGKRLFDETDHAARLAELLSAYPP